MFEIEIRCDECNSSITEGEELYCRSCYSQVEELEAENEELQSEVERLEGQVEELEEEIQQLKEED